MTIYEELMQNNSPELIAQIEKEYPHIRNGAESIRTRIIKCLETGERNVYIIQALTGASDTTIRKYLKEYTWDKQKKEPEKPLKLTS